MTYASHALFEAQQERDRIAESWDIAPPMLYCADCFDWYTYRQARTHRTFEKHTRWYNERGEQVRP